VAEAAGTTDDGTVVKVAFEVLAEGFTWTY
jgi:hypothetical protein